VDDRTLLRRVWAAFGCALNPEDYQPTVRAAMWEQVISMAEESYQRSSRVYRENQQLERELAALRAPRLMQNHIIVAYLRTLEAMLPLLGFGEHYVSAVREAAGALEGEPDVEGSDRG